MIDHSCVYSSIAQLLRCWTNAAADLPAQTGNDLVGRIWCLCSRHLQTRWVSARHRPLDTAEPIFVTPFLQCPRHRVSLLTTYTRCAHHAAHEQKHIVQHALCPAAINDWHHDACMHACMSVSNAWWLECIERCVSLSASVVKPAARSHAAS